MSSLPAKTARLIERPEGGRFRRLTVMATKADYDGLAEQLAAIGRPIVVGLKATSNYHRALVHRLLAAGFELRLISSVALARTREALHNGSDKNDPKDAQVIPTYYLPLYFREIASFAGKSRSDWFLALLERFPTRAGMTEPGPDGFSAEAWPLVGRKVARPA